MRGSASRKMTTPRLRDGCLPRLLSMKAPHATAPRACLRNPNPSTPWRDAGLTRDYFHVEDRTGGRFWLFREGLFGRETIQPRWFMHGMFG